MDANNLELRATETLLERGVRVRVRAPFLFRLLGKEKIVLTLRAPTGGALLRMGEWYLRCQLSVEALKEISLEDALLFQSRHGDNIYRALACLFLVDKRMTKILMKPFANYLREALPIKDALTLLELTILHGGLADFMTITRLVKAKTITPPKLGQATKRS